MTPKLLEASLREGVSQGNIRYCFDKLIEFRDAGGTREQALAIVESLRKQNEIPEDSILTIMDYVTGWCSPEYRIWTNDVCGGGPP